MNNINFINVWVIVVLSLSLGKSQDLLTIDDAVSSAIENNFGVQIAKNQSDIALNNTSIYNTGKLPTLGLSAAYNYNLDNTTANFQDGRSTTLSFAPSQGFNSNLGANYTVFDGFIRRYNIDQLQEQYQLSKIEIELAMENIAAQTLQQYYQVCLLEESQNLLEESFSITKDRLDRARTQESFAQTNRLAILNAEVDFNNDSLALIDVDMQIKNAKRTLNNLIMRKGGTDYGLNKNVDFIEGLMKDVLEEKMLSQNISIDQLDKTIQIGEISLKIADARKMPVIGLNANYGFVYNKNNPASFLSSLTNNGFVGGVTLSWNIFDGGTRKHSMEQVKLNNIGLELQKQQLIEDLKLQLDTAWETYLNAKQVYQIQAGNVEISEQNFTRSQEQYNIGQITAVELRQAQLNLLNARTNYTSAKYQIKVSEIALLLLSGQILN